MKFNIQHTGFLPLNPPFSKFSHTTHTYKCTHTFLYLFCLTIVCVYISTIHIFTFQLTAPSMLKTRIKLINLDMILRALPIKTMLQEVLFVPNTTDLKRKLKQQSYAQK